MRSVWVAFQGQSPPCSLHSGGKGKARIHQCGLSALADPAPRSSRFDIFPQEANAEPGTLTFWFAGQPH